MRMIATRLALAALLLVQGASAQLPPAGNSVLLRWTASATPNVNYEIWSAAHACNAATPVYVKVAEGVTGTSYTHQGALTSGARSYYMISVSTVNGGRSALSSCADVVIPVPPNPPTGITGTVVQVIVTLNQ